MTRSLVGACYFCLASQVCWSNPSLKEPDEGSALKAPSILWTREAVLTTRNWSVRLNSGREGKTGPQETLYKVEMMVMKIWNPMSHNPPPLSPSGPNNLTRKEPSWAGSSLYLQEFSKGEMLSRIKERLKGFKVSTSSHLQCRKPVNHRTELWGGCGWWVEVGCIAQGQRTEVW